MEDHLNCPNTAASQSGNFLWGEIEFNMPVDNTISQVIREVRSHDQQEVGQCFEVYNAQLV
jgi:hypothetical protein